MTHDEFHNLTMPYLAGALTDDERAGYEAHAAECEACGASLAQSQAADREMNTLFVSARPDGALEDRVIGRLRAARRMPMVLHPMVRRAAVGVAAAILLGGAGFVVTHADSANRIKVVSNLKQMGLAVGIYANESRGQFPRTYYETPRDMAHRLSKQVKGKDAILPGLLDTSKRDESKDKLYLGTEVTRFDSYYARPEERFAKPAEPQLREKSEGGQQQGGHAVSHETVAGKAIRELNRSSGDEGKPQAAHGVAVGQTGGQVVNGGTVISGNNTFGGFSAPATRKPTSEQQNGTTPGFSEAPNFSLESDSKRVRADYTNGHVDWDVDKSGAAESLGRGTTAVRFKPAEITGGGEGHNGATAPQGGKLVDSEYAFVAVRGMPGNGRQTVVSGGTLVLSDGNSNGKQNAPADAAKKAAGKPAGESAAGAVAFGVEAVDELREKIKENNTLELRDAPAAPRPAEGAPKGVQPPPEPAPVVQQQPPNAGRKIIRNGDMTFEVDSYDSAVVQITKISTEEGGFVATTESEKLPNGKVKGSVIVRVPPERLDTLVLKLRGLGDLKTSRVAATDITKQYTDLDSQLRAGRAMEERLLEIIKSGKGEIKDLLEAEKQLGSWREKIEHLEGEIRYYNNLISLSTLTVTLSERDIRTASLLSETEQVNMGVESEDVEKARTEAIKAIDAAKGRIVESNLKKHDAGQFSATIVADIAPDAAGPAIDRLKQLGRVARLEVQRHQTTAEGTGAPAPGARVERKDTRLMLSIYNLANVAARNTTSLQLAADDVEKSYREILAQIESAGGRVINSQLVKPTPEQTTGVVTFESPTGAADVLLGAVRGVGEVMRLDTSTNPDTQNVTDAKRGFSVQIRSLASVPARESVAMRLAARDVADAFNKLREAVRGAGGILRTSQLAEQDRSNVGGQLDFEVKRDNLAAVQTALVEAGVTLAREVNRSTDNENTVDSKVLYRVTLADERTVPPRESVALQLAVDDVPTKYEKLLAALREAGARVLSSQINQNDPTQVSASLEIDARRENREAVDKALTEAGGIYGRASSRSAEGQPAMEDKVRLQVTINDADNLPARERTTMGVETKDVTQSANDLELTAVALGGRKVTSDWAQDPAGQTVARIVLDVPLTKAADLLTKARDQGKVLTIQHEQAPTAPDGAVGRARLTVTFATADPILARDQGLGASIRSGLATSAEWLLASVTWIVVGLCLVLPWAIVLWIVWRVVRRRKARLADTGPLTPAVS